MTLVAGTPAAAQAPDAAERCTPDVMRLCSEFVPDPDRIVDCLKRKGPQLSRSCLTALTYKPPKEANDDGSPKKRRPPREASDDDSPKKRSKRKH